MLREQLDDFRKELNLKKGLVWKAQMGLISDARVNSMTDTLKTKAAEAKASRKFLLLFRQSMFKFTDNADMLTYFIDVQAIALPVAIPLGFLTMLHEESTRYPPLGRSDFWTNGAYTPGSKMVRLLPILIAETSRYCNAILDAANMALAYRARTTVLERGLQ